MEALARALGDPSLALGCWFRAEARYVDRDGRPVEPPGPGSDRRSMVVERDGQPVALLIHDAALEHNAGLVESACAAGLALENERLAADVASGSRKPIRSLPSARERDVLALMAEGRSNKAIAERLFVSEYTVQKHVGNIFDTLRLPPSPDDHRRVLAVVAYLNAQ